MSVYVQPKITKIVLLTCRGSDKLILHYDIKTGIKHDKSYEDHTGLPDPRLEDKRKQNTGEI